MKSKKLGGIVNQRAIDDDNTDEIQSNGNYNYYENKLEDDNGSFRYDSSYQPRNKHLEQRNSGDYVNNIENYDNEEGRASISSFDAEGRKAKALV